MPYRNGWHDIRELRNKARGLHYCSGQKPVIVFLPSFLYVNHPRCFRRNNAFLEKGDTSVAARSTPQSPVELFYSYAHEDEALRQELQKHLALLKREGRISEWHDRDITAGAEWRGQINTHLNSATLILLLVSADFIASEYCYDMEMRRALERHAAGEVRVIPIILRPVDNWQNAPFGRLQVLPTDAKPVTEWENLDRAFADVANGIRRALQATPEKSEEPVRQPISPAQQVPPSSPVSSTSSLSTYENRAAKAQGKTVNRWQWWRNATVVAAIIAAFAAIVVAVIQNVSFGTHPKEGNTISQHTERDNSSAVGTHSKEGAAVSQHTEGDNSPAVSGTNGNVTINIGPAQKRERQ
jgi:TIR domain